MREIEQEKINRYRKQTYRTHQKNRITKKEQAAEFVDERGFIYFWPIKGIELPSLWVAVAGNRPVASAHDDPGHVTWGWKDTSLGGKEWFYAKVLRKKATLISLETVPYFYALSENYGSPEEDYLTIYEQGKLTQEAKAVYEVLLEHGPLDTIALRSSARLSSRKSESRFNRALADLQTDFKICPIGVAEAGAWRYAFIYDILPRHYPGIPEKARNIQERQARRTLCRRYYESVGASRLNDVIKLFRWHKTEAKNTIDDLVAEGVLTPDCQVGNSTGDWIVLTSLLP